MKHIFNYIIGLTLVLALFSCQKDPMKEIVEGDWNTERNVLSLSLQNQFGPAIVFRDEYTTTVTAFVNKIGLDLSAVKIEDIVLSYGASSNVAAGGTLNFDNEDKKAELTVMSSSGDELKWTIVVKPYEMFYIGKWTISEEKIYVEQEWGSNFDKNIEEPFPTAAPELDNGIKITYGGYEDGRTHGTIDNTKGNDGEYGVFGNENVDITGRIRHLIPEGESTWEMDLSTNTMYITKDGKTSEALVTKEGGNVKLTYVLAYKTEEPSWDFGDRDNYLCWSNQYEIVLAAAK